MAKWRPKNIYIYFNDIFGSMGENCLPYMPESFTCNINGRNEEMDILHGVGSDEGLAGTMNFIKRPGLKTWSIECFFSHPDRPLYATVKRSHHWTPEFWVEFFESAMYQRKVLEMTVSGLDIVTYVTIENFKHTKEAGEEIDTYYTIEIKEYQFQEIKQEEINIKQEIPKYDGQNTNQQQTTTNINIDNGGWNAWLVGTAWKNENDIQLITSTDSKVLHFDWLKVKVLNKKTMPPVNCVLKDQYLENFNENAPWLERVVKTDDNKNINLEETYTALAYRYVELILNKKSDNKLKAKMRVLVLKYLEKAYAGATKMCMPESNYRKIEYGGRRFFYSLIDSNSYRWLLKSGVPKGISGPAFTYCSAPYSTLPLTDLDKIVKIRSNYVGVFIDEIACMECKGKQNIAQVESIEEYHPSASAGDFQKLNRGGSINNINYTLNKGDKMWCVDDEATLRIKNDNNFPFTLQYAQQK